MFDFGSRNKSETKKKKSTNKERGSHLQRALKFLQASLEYCEICVKCLYTCLVVLPLFTLQCFKVSLGNEHLTPGKMWFLKKGDAFAVHCISYKHNHSPDGRVVRRIFAAVLSYALSPWEHFSRRGTRW